MCPSPPPADVDAIASSLKHDYANASPGWSTSFGIDASKFGRSPVVQIVVEHPVSFPELQKKTLVSSLRL